MKIARLLTFLAVFWGAQTSAAVIWDWQFENENLGVVSPTTVIQGKAILHNNSTDGEAITGYNDPEIFKTSAMVQSTGISQVMLNGDYSYSNTLGFGSHELFPWESFVQFFHADFYLGAGGTSIFDFVWISSNLPSGFLPGAYSVEAQIGICNITCDSIITINRTLSWTVADSIAVTEPSSLMLLILTLIGVGMRRISFKH